MTRNLRRTQSPPTCKDRTNRHANCKKIRRLKILDIIVCVMSNNNEENDDDDLYKSVIRFNEELWERYQWMCKFKTKLKRCV
jgi:hypothetical protein